MLDVKNPNAIEETVCVKIEKAKQHPLEKNDMKLLMNLCFAKEVEVAQKLKENEKDDSLFLYNVLRLRIENIMTVKVESRVMLFLAMMSKNPAVAVMYAWYLQYWGLKNKVQSITLDVLNMHMFPMGYPSEETLHQIWDSQKVKGQPDNLVDYPSAGQSLMF